MTLVFEYEHAYGRIEPARDSWAKFLAGVARCGRFTARQLYFAVMGPSFALSSLSSENAGETLQMRQQLSAAAFGTPQVREPQRLIIGPDEA